MPKEFSYFSSSNKYAFIAMFHLSLSFEIVYFIFVFIPFWLIFVANEGNIKKINMETFAYCLTWNLTKIFPGFCLLRWIEAGTTVLQWNKRENEQQQKMTQQQLIKT